MSLELPIYLFHQGTNYKSYEILGSHFGVKDKKNGVFFRVWAPKADEVSVLGDFNQWNEELAVPMQKISDNGVWEAFIPGLKKFDSYKYAIKHAGKTVLKADPFAFHA